MNDNTNNKISLSIAIPTWNRAPRLEKLLDSILFQTKELKGEVEICVSDNNSSDNTMEIVTGFQKKYPGLINYNKNKENIGAERNMLLLMEMAKGDFIWLMGDDDLITSNGLNEVINFIKKNKEEKIGLIVVKLESYFINKSTGQKIIFGNSFDKDKPEIFKIDKKDIIGLNFPEIAFISVLIFNNRLLSKIMMEDRVLIEQGIGTKHIHMILFALMFLKYPELDGIVFNKVVVNQELPQYKYFIEDKFILHYQVQKELNNLLLSNKYMNNDYAPLIIQRDKELKWCFIADMMVMRAFKTFNYFSYFGCLKLFFHNATFIDMLLFSFVFSILFLTPSIILRSLYKGLLIIRHGKKWKTKWNIASKAFCWLSRGVIRRV